MFVTEEESSGLYRSRVAKVVTVERGGGEVISGEHMVEFLSCKLERKSWLYCLSASEPAIHNEVRNCSHLFLLLPQGSNGFASTKATVNVLLFLLRWFQNLNLDVSGSSCEKRIILAYLERTQQALIHTHHCSSIVKLSTVVGRTEKCNQLPL